MKKTHVLLLSVCALAACDRDNVMTGLSNEVSLPIALSSDLMGGNAATRAYYTGIDDFKTYGFGIYGYKYKTDSKGVSGYTEIFAKDKVSYDSGLQLWCTSPVRYWDRGADSYIFAAYGPQSASVTATAPEAGNAGAAKLTFSGIPQWQDITDSETAADGVKDYVVARHSATIDSYIGMNGIVPLDFYHLLARFTIKAYCISNTDPDGVNYVIGKIELGSQGKRTAGSGGSTETVYYNVPADTVKRTATFNYADNTGSSLEVSECTFRYETGNTRVKSLYDCTSGTGLDGSETVPSPDPDKPNTICSWLVAPFDITEMGGYITVPQPELTLTVTLFTRQEENGAYKYASAGNANVIKLGKTLTGFEMGKDYSITIKIDRGGIDLILDVATTEWQVETGNQTQHTVYNW